LVKVKLTVVDILSFVRRFIDSLRERCWVVIL
jgi:hypothetical protein